MFHDNLVPVKRIKAELGLNRPIITGLTVLDLSKAIMYKFHYEHVKEKYLWDRSKLLFTDTVSLVYSIRPNNL